MNTIATEAEQIIMKTADIAGDQENVIAVTVAFQPLLTVGCLEVPE
jgi:cephalosporin hydroxylase